MPEVARVLLHRRQAVPAQLEDAAREALDALHQLIQASTQDAARLYADLFHQYRQELLVLFSAYSATPVPQLEEPSGEPIVLRAQWNGAAIRRDGRQAEPSESLRELLRALMAVNVEDFTDALSEAAEEGYERELWLLGLAGIDGVEALLDLGPDDWGETLQGDGYDNLNWQDRLAVWNRDAEEKTRRWLGAAMLTGWTWEATDERLDRLITQHTNHVTGLLGNELTRAFTLGAGLALLTARSSLGIDVREVWLTRDDPKVCPVCRAKHMTVTSDRPVDDTHPGCRCIKVPVPANYTPVAPLSFETFRGER